MELTVYGCDHGDLNIGCLKIEVENLPEHEGLYSVAHLIHLGLRH
jgi:hypothetical protein